MMMMMMMMTIVAVFGGYSRQCGRGFRSAVMQLAGQYSVHCFVRIPAISVHGGH